MEGTKITLNVPPGNSGSLGMNKNDTITVDTSNILFIFMGAFTGLEKIIFEKVSKIDRVSIKRNIFIICLTFFFFLAAQGNVKRYFWTRSASK